MYRLLITMLVFSFALPAFGKLDIKPVEKDGLVFFRGLPTVNAIKAAEANNLQVTWDDRYGYAMTVRGNLGNITTNPERLVELVAPLYAPNSQNCSYQLLKQKDDFEGGSHYKYQQLYHGVPVWEGGIACHADGSGNVNYVCGGIIPIAEHFSVEPNLNANQAEGIAINLAGFNPQRVNSELVIFPFENRINLCWKVIVADPVKLFNETYFIDAKTGEQIFNYCNLKFADGPSVIPGVTSINEPVEVNCYQEDRGNNKYYYHSVDISKRMYRATKPLEFSIQNESLTRKFLNMGIIASLDGRECWSNSYTGKLHRVTSAEFKDKPGIDISHYCSEIYNYYLDSLGRDSWTGDGASIGMHSHVPDPYYGGPMSNAFWDPSGSLWYFGVGGGDYRSFTASIEVIAHEFQHAVTGTEVSLTVSQPGAINEHLSDFFGYLLDPTDFLLGEDIQIKPDEYGRTAIRNMEDPTWGSPFNPSNPWNQPAHMNQIWKYGGRPSGANDYGGVHINCGILNKAAYIAIQGLGNEKPRDIWYKALNEHYIPDGSSFLAFAEGIVKASEDLYGAESLTRRIVYRAFQNVGLYDAAPSLPTANMCYYDEQSAIYSEVALDGGDKVAIRLSPEQEGLMTKIYMFIAAKEGTGDLFVKIYNTENDIPGSELLMDAILPNIYVKTQANNETFSIIDVEGVTLPLKELFLVLEVAMGDKLTLWSDDGTYSIEPRSLYYNGTAWEPITLPSGKKGNLVVGGELALVNPASVKPEVLDNKVAELKAYPNPSPNQVLFNLDIPNYTGNLQLFDVKGRNIRSLQPQLHFGDDTMTYFVWDGKDSNANDVPNGVYFAQTTMANSTRILITR